MKTIESKHITKNYILAIDIIFTNIEEKLKNENVVLKGSLSSKDELKELFTDCKVGIRAMARLKNILNKAIDKPSFRNINYALHLLCKLKGIPSIRIYNEKHEKIQHLRKEWKKCEWNTEASLAAYRMYREEKGDFYKKNPIF